MLQGPRPQGGSPALNALGVPLPCSGNFADVYQLTSAGGTRWAVKCFTRGEPASLRRRYAEIDTHLQKARLPFAVGFQFLDQGIRVRGAWHPVLKMQWVEGLTLNQFVRDRLDKPALLDGLLSIWVRMGRRLREAGMAHADLQHGNVLLVPGATANALGVKLIDYDGMWVPAMAGERSGEVGHPAYQHPRRLQDGTYSKEVDRFPLLVVAAALRCLRVGGRVLWERYDNGDNLLFREEDFQAPVRSQLFAELWKLQDPQARLLLGKLEEACKQPLEQAPHLDELLPELAAPITARKPAAAAGPSAVTAQPVATGEPGSTFADLGEPTEAPAARIQRRRYAPAGRGKRGWVGWALGGGAAVAAVAGAVLLVLVVAAGRKEDPNPPDDRAEAGQVEKKDAPPDQKKDALPDQKKDDAPDQKKDDAPDQKKDAPPDQKKDVPPDRKKDDPPDQKKDAPPDEKKDAPPDQKKDGGRLPAQRVALKAPADLTVTPGEERTVVLKIDAEQPDKVRTELRGLPAGVEAKHLGTDSQGTARWLLQVRPEAAAEESDVTAVALLAGEVRAQGRFRLTVKREAVVQRPPDRPKQAPAPRTEETRRFETKSPAQVLQFSPDGQSVLGDADLKLQVWDPATGKTRQSFPRAAQVNGIAWMPDGRRFLVAANLSPLQLIDAQTGEARQPLEGNLSDPWGVSLSADGRRVAVSFAEKQNGGAENKQPSVRVYDLESGKLLRTVNGVSAYRRDFSLSADGRQLFIKSLRGLMLVDVDTGEERPTPSSPEQHAWVVCGGFVPGGRQLILVWSTGRLALWDPQTGKEARLVADDARSVQDCFCSPDGRYVVGIVRGEEVGPGQVKRKLSAARVWETATGREVARIEHPETLYHAAISPDGRWVVTSSADKVVRVWDFRQGGGDTKPTRATLFEANATPAVAADDDNTPNELGVKFRSSLAGTITALRFYKGEGNTGKHVGHLWAADGTLLATTTFTRETDTGWQEAAFDRPVAVAANTTYVASYFAPNGHYSRSDDYFASSARDRPPLKALADGADGPNGVFRFRPGPDGGFPNQAHKGRNYWVDVVFAPSSRDPAPPSGGVPAASSGATEVREMKNGRLLVRGLNFSPDGTRLVGTGTDAMVWDYRTGGALFTSPESRGTLARSAAFLPDNRRVVMAVERSLVIWDPSAGSTRTVGSHRAPVTGLAVSADGKRAVTASGAMARVDGKPKLVDGRLVWEDCFLRVWDLRSGKELHSRETRSPVHRLGLSADGKRALFVVPSETALGTAMLWDTETGKDLFALDTRAEGSSPSTIIALDLTADGRFAALALANRTVQVWDLSSRKAVARTAAVPSRIHDVALSADARYLLTGGGQSEGGRPPRYEDCTARLFEVSSGRELIRMEGHTKPVTAVAFSDGREVVTAGDDRTVRVWQLKGVTLPDRPPMRPSGAEESEPPARTAEKKAPPADEDVQAALKLVRDLYKADYARTRPLDRAALADKLLARGREAKDPAERYVLMKESADLSVQAGNPGQAVAALDLLAGEFTVDELALKFAALSAAARTVTGADGHKSLAEGCLAALEDALAAEDLATATKLADLAEPAARRCQDQPTSNATLARVKDIRDAAREAEAAGTAAAKLKTTPDDAAANAVRGKFLCFRVGAWERGLPLLAKGDDAPLKVVAAADLRRPAGGEDRAKLADEWFELSRTRPELGKTELLRRAAHWYHQALDGKVGGLVKDKVDRQLKLVEQQLPPTRSLRAGSEIRKLEGMGGTVLGVAFLPDGSALVAVGEDGQPRMWDLAGKERAAFRSLQRPLKAVVVPDGKRFVTINQSSVTNWEVEDRAFRGHGYGGGLQCLALLGKSGQVIFGTADGTLWTTDGAGGGDIVTSRSAAGSITALAVPSDGRAAVVGSENGGLFIQPLVGRGKMVRFGAHTGPVHAVALTPDGLRALSVGADGGIRTWDMKGPREGRRLTGHAGPVACVSVSPDGRKAVSGGEDGTVRVWDLRSGTELRRFSGHKGKVTAVAFSPDGRKIVSGGEDRTVRLWGL